MGMEMSVSAISDSGRTTPNRLVQLLIGIVCMVMIANLQYGWTFFVNPMNKQFGWTPKDIAFAFTLFVLFETWLVPVEGWFVDRFGPKAVVIFGGALAGGGWIINSYADTLTMLYLGQIVGGIGAGAVYGTCVGNALRWFPDHRGAAAGWTAAGFGMGSAATVVPIQNMIASAGFQSTFFWFGLVQGLICVALAFLLLAPRPGEVPEVVKKVLQTRRNYTPVEMVQTPIFWLMYVMFVMMAAGGLMATAQLAPIAKDFGVDQVKLNLWIWVPTALTLAASLDRILNGLTRPFFGWVSDHIGRENTMFIAFGLEAVGIWALYAFGKDPVAFAVLSGVVFFAWGEIYSLFPSTCTDTYGPEYAATNAGLLYTAKGTAALWPFFAAWLVELTGNWKGPFLAAVAMNALAAVLALFVLKPMRQRWLGSDAVAARVAARAAE
jgi:OFA family oxalate/formate antiporter-like MFS transporter